MKNDRVAYPESVPTNIIPTCLQGGEPTSRSLVFKKKIILDQVRK